MCDQGVWSEYEASILILCMWDLYFTSVDHTTPYLVSLQFRLQELGQKFRVQAHQVCQSRSSTIM